MKSRGPRTNRLQDLVYLPLSYVAFAAMFQVWEFGAERVFGSSGVPAMAVALVFPIAALPIYTRLALGFGPMLVQLLALALLVQVVPAILPHFGVQTLAGGIVGALAAAHPAGRGSIVTAGAWAGAASAAVFVLGSAQALPVSALVSGAAGALVGGTLAGAAVLAVSPILERIFGHVTPLTLIEALSYDHPLLRRLMTRAPGTFLHSTNLAVLTDAAARAIGADALVARVGALYHDVGKTAAPEYFIENQRGASPESALSAEQTARVLVDHVTNGAALILSFGLGQRIADFAVEHHGTTTMRSLLEKAEREGLSDLRALQYPGPRPRSKETALVMIGDQLEAISRAIAPKTIEECLSLAQETEKRIETDGQLAESGLTPADLAAAQQAFADVLYAIHHRRVGYPSTQLTPPPLPMPNMIGVNPSRR